MNLEQVLKALQERRIDPAEAAARVQALREAQPPATAPAVGAIAGQLTDSLAAALYMDRADVNPRKRFIDMGLDSIVGVEWIRTINQHHGLELTAARLYDYPTIQSLAEFVAMELTGRAGPAGEVAVPAPASTSVSASVPAPVVTAPAADAVPPDTAIAVIGLSGRYPQAATPAAFWDNLRAGRDSITEVPAERWDHQRYYHPDKVHAGTAYGRWGGFIDEVDRFDPLFFNISPREALRMDPQERLFLETVWALFESAGQTRALLRQRHGGRVGVYVGAMYQQYGLLAGAGDGASAAFSSFSAIANRVSWFFGLEGPSIAVDTMCSSSAMAIHVACRDLAAGACEVAVAGGVNLTLHPKKFIALSEGQLIGSHPGCRSFAQGDGFLPAEGVGAVLLKPLAKARADGDRVLAVIRATATGHGGRGGGYTVPNADMQARLIDEVLGRAAVTVDTVSYVESAANGSPLGDAAEIAALTAVFGAGAEHRCAIGSVKANIGHAESASGISQLSKVVLQLQHGELAPSVKAEPANPAIRWEATPFFLPSTVQPWTRPQQDGRDLPRRALINSFGAGGSYVVLLVEEGDAEPAPQAAAAAATEVIVMSAHTRERLAAVARRLLDYCVGTPAATLADIAHTLQIGREAMPVRLALVAADRDGLCAGLQAFLDGADAPGYIGEALEPTAAETSADDAGWIERATPEQIAQRWVAGAAIDWRRLRRGTAQLLSLPTYPFARQRCWLAGEPAAPAVAEPMPTAPAPVGLAARVAALLGIEPAQLPVDKPLALLGFTSLDAIRLRHLLEREHGGELSLQALRVEQSLAELERAVGVALTTAGNTGPAQPVLEPRPEERHQPFPLTDIQEAFLTGRKLGLDGDRVGCHIYFETPLRDIDIYRLNNAWQRLVAHHPMLRAVFLPEGRQQILQDTLPFRIKAADLRQLDAEQRSAALAAQRERMSHRVYEPDRWPLFDIRVSLCPDGVGILHFSIDELLLDASGLRLLLQQWQRLYRDPAATLVEPAVTFRDYVLAVKRFEDSPRSRGDLDYWLGRLRRPLRGPTLPGPVVPPAADGSRRRRRQGGLDASRWAAIKHRAAGLGISPTVLLLTVFAELLRRAGDGEPFALILTYFNRPPLHDDLDRVLGPFISTTLFEPVDAGELEQRLHDNQSLLWQDLDHSNVSGIRVLRELKAQRRLEGERPSPVVFTSLLHLPEGGEAGPRHSLFEFLGQQPAFTLTQTPQVYLDHQVAEYAGDLRYSWDVAEARFAPGLIDRLFTEYRCALEQLAAAEPWTLALIAPGPSPVAAPPALQPEPAARLQPFPLTDLQQAYVFGRAAGGGCLFYQEIEFDTVVPAAVEQAWHALVERHDMLRARVLGDGTQCIDPVDRTAIAIDDWRDRDTDEVAQTMAATAAAMVDDGGAGDPPFALRLSLLAGGRGRLHIAVNMLIADGGSFVRLINEFCADYAVRAAGGAGIERASLAVSFRDYVMAMARQRHGAEPLRCSAYWRDKFAQLPGGPLLPLARRTVAGAAAHRRFSAPLPGWPALREQAEALAVAPGTVLLAAYLEVLAAWSGRQPFAVVVPTWQRPPLHPQLGELVGDFTAMAWIEADLQRRPFATKLRHYHDQLQADLAHQTLSGIQALRKVPPRERPAFPVVFTDLLPPFATPPAGVRIGKALSKTAQVCLDNISSIGPVGLLLAWDVAEDVYPPGLVSALFESYQRLLAALVDHPQSWYWHDFDTLIQASPAAYSNREDGNEYVS